MLSKYELVLVMSPKVSEEKENKLIKLIEDIIGKNGKIADKNRWGKKIMAYDIDKNHEGIYWLLNMETSGKEVKSLRDKFKVEQDIIRYLFVKKG